jgi:Tol biopolymer transport system component
MRPFWHRHVSESDLSVLADSGTATPQQESHLAACPHCAERLSAHRRIGRVLATEWVNTTVALPHATRTTPRAALAFPVVALAAVVVAALVFRGIGGPATASPSPEFGLVHDPSSPAAKACHPATPAATATGGPNRILPLPSDAYSTDSVHWSPDGKHFIIATFGWEVFDAGGLGLAQAPSVQPVSSVFSATWLDSNTYAILETGADDSPGPVNICGLDGSAVTLPGSYVLANRVGAGIVGNGHGALAVATSTSTFRVWANGTLSKSVAGYPMEWSPDGTKLLIATAFGQDPGDTTDGPVWDSVAIVSYPSLQRTATFGDVQLVAQGDKIPALDFLLSFSPDGRSVGFSCGRWATTASGCGPGVLDVATEHSTALTGNFMTIGWLPDSRLLVASNSGQLQLEEWDGSKLVPSALPAQTISVSAAGIAAVEDQTDNFSTTSFVANGMPFLVLPKNATEIDWSPDGSHLVLIGQPANAAFALFLIDLPRPPPSGSATPAPSGQTACDPATPPTPPTPGPNGVVPIELPKSSLGMDSFHWSPDGKHVIYAGQGWELLDQSGRVLAESSTEYPNMGDTYSATWLDSNRYALYHDDPGDTAGRVTICGLDGSAVDLAGTYGGGMVANGRGALAVTLAGSYTAPNFAIWANGTLSKVVPGFPLRWSPDGSELLIATSSVQDPGSMADGTWWQTVAVVSYPSLQQTTTFEGIQLVTNFGKGRSLDSFVSFSPDGRSIASSWTRRQDVQNSGGAAILDVATGQAEFMPDKLGPICWLPDGRLLVRPMTATPGPLQEWDGISLSPSDLPPTTLSVSPTGALLVDLSANDQSLVRFVVDGRTILDLKENVWGFGEIDWSPDGSHLVLIGQPAGADYALSLISLR